MLLLLAASACLAAAASPAAAAATFFLDAPASGPATLAAKTTARYLHLLQLAGGALPQAAAPGAPPAPAAPGAPLPNFVFTSSALPLHPLLLAEPQCAPPAPGAAPGAYTVCRTAAGGGGLVGVLARDAPGVLYGAVALLEALGLRFALGGAVLPPAAALAQRGGLAAALPPGARLAGAPVFDVRGLQPFHDFYEGPDAWSADAWALVAESIAMMKGNALAIHTYPYAPTLDTGTNEPAVWLGPEKYVQPDGSVTAAYPTSWASTQRSEWGDVGMNSSAYFGGAADLFDFECSGHPAQAGNSSRCPWPTSPGASVDVFNDVGRLWAQQFPLWKSMGVRSILGTESPMPLPPFSDTVLPLNVFYSASRGDHFVTTTDCAQCEGDGYVLLGVEGAVYGSAQAAPPGSLALSTYYNGVTMDNMLVAQGQPIPPGYSLVRVEGYAPAAAGAEATLALWQFQKSAGGRTDHWAVAGANFTAAAQAQGFANSSSLLAYVLPASSAETPTSLEYFTGAFTRLQRLLGDSLDTYWVWTPEYFEWNKININDPRIQTVKGDLLAAQAARDALNASFNLATCGWVVGPLGARWYLDTVLPPNWSISSIDQNVGNTPVDAAYANITRHKKWAIPWLEDDPGLSSLQLWVNRTLEHNKQAQGFGVNGLLNIHWRTRSISPQTQASHAYAWNSSLQSADFWLDWALASFGPSAAPGAAGVFGGLDSYLAPRPVDWIGGPGGWNPGGCRAPSDPAYAFPDAFYALRPLLLADLAAGAADAAALERFDYWLTTLRYTRGIARSTCAWGQYNDVVAAIGKLPAAQRPAAAQGAGYAAWGALVGNVTECMWHLLSSASSLGEWGTVVNTQSHTILPRVVGPAQAGALAALAGVPALPPALLPPRGFDAQRVPLLRVPVARASLAQGEDLLIRAFLVAAPQYSAGAVLTLFTAPLAGGAWQEAPVPLAPSDGPPRSAWQVVVPAGALPPSGLRWYIRAVLPGNSSAFDGPFALLPSPGAAFSPGAITLLFPPTAPAVPQTVIVL